MKKVEVYSKKAGKKISVKKSTKSIVPTSVQGWSNSGWSKSGGWFTI